MQQFDLSTYKPTDLSVKYLIESEFRTMANDRYKQEIKGEVSLWNEIGNKLADVATISAIKLLIDVGQHEGCGIFSICDVDGLSMEVGQIVYDFIKGDWSDAMINLYEEPILAMNLLIFTELEINKPFDSWDIHKYLVKDLYNNFIQGVGIYVLSILGLIPDFSATGMPQAWKLNRSGSRLVRSRSSPLNKAIRYYEKIGFSFIPESPDLMFMCPERVNKKFDKVKLE